MYVGDKEHFIKNCLHVLCLNTCRSKTSEKTFTFYAKLLNCSAVGCTNRSTKNPNLSFHRVRDEWLQNIKKKELLPKKFYICSDYFEKDCSGRDLKMNTIIVILCTEKLPFKDVL